MYSAKQDAMVMLQDVQCADELEPLMELHDYVDAALARINWAVAALQFYIQEKGGDSNIPPQSGASSSEG